MDVLSIDFDIIMAPTIEYYNHMTPKRRWEEMQEENPGLIIPKADLNHYNFIIRLLDKVIKKDTEIYVSYNHKKIVDFLKNDKNLNIINIDHHHDLGYRKEEEIPNCSNWAKNLFDQKKMNNYIWAKNINSRMPMEFILEQIQEYNYTIENFNSLKEKILNINFNKIFICLSPEWVPPYYHTLFYGILDLINQKLGCHLEIHEGE